MKRFMALFLALSILFSLAAVNVAAVGEQAPAEQIVNIEESVENTDGKGAEDTSVPEENTLELTAPVVADASHADHAACPCGISGASCASHSSAAAAVAWEKWTSTNSLPTTAGNYYLSGEVTLTSQQVLNADIKICLNGFDIKEGTRTEASSSRNALIRVGDSGTLTIMNCKATITGGRLAAGSAGIKGGTATGTSAGAIHVNAGRTLNLYGVQVSGNTCSNTNANGWTAGGILVVSEASKPSNLNIAYSRFDGNKATAARGGAIIIRGGTADIRNTVFANNEAKTMGGALYVMNVASTVNITNCDFTGNKTTNTSAEGGAALYTAVGSVTMKNVTITGNENKGNHGTAFTCGGTSTLTLDDCTVTGNNNTNSYSTKKAGIAVVNDNANVIVKGATKIDDNMNGTGGSSPAECNLYLRTSGSKLTVDALETGASIRITSGDQSVSDDPDVFLKYNDNTPVIDPKNQDWLIYENREKLGDANCVIGYKADTTRFYFGAMASHRHAACACAISGATCADHTSAAEAVMWQEWNSTGTLPTSAGYYYLAGTVTLTKQQVINEDVKICLNGFDIVQGNRTEAAGSRNAIIRVGDSGTLTMMNCGAVISGGKLAAGSAGVKGFTADGTSGGAFHVNSGRTLNLYGVQVSDNTCTNSNANGWTAGGILTVANDNDNLKLNINYCRFEDNKAPNANGGAIIIRGGAADIRNTVFSGNEAKTKGGAIFVVNKASNLKLTNCDFTGNKTTASNAEGGAALYTGIGTTVLTNVTMTGNENAGNHGTAITYGGSSILTLDDCTVTGNRNTSTSNAKKAGIALVNSNAKMTVMGKTVIDNNMNGLNNANPVECNLYLRTDGSKLIVGALEDGASIRVSTGDHTVTDEPDVFLTYNDKTPVMVASQHGWLIYENRELAGNKAHFISYSDDDNRFYFEADNSHSHPACACAISGATCDVTESTARWKEWTADDSLPTTAGYYHLTKEVVLSSQQMINEDVHICLNGFSITEGTRTEAAGSRNAIIRVGDTGTLTMVNCQAVIVDGKLAAGSAGVKGFNADGLGAAFHVNSGRTLNLYGVEVSGNTNTNSSTADWAPGAILAVGNENDKLQLNINYCRFDSNKTTNANGGAITLRGGTANILNTVFNGNEAMSKGGTIYMVNKAIALNMTNCEFTGNKTTDSEARGGACIHQNIGVTTLVNVTMTGNVNMGHDGTAVTLTGSADLTLDGCTVTGNENKNAYNSKKAGIAVISDTAKIAVKGVTVIDDNMNGLGGSSPAECNLFLRTSGTKLKVEGLEAGAMIRITTGDHTVTDDPDVFLSYTDKTPVMDPDAQAWLFYENREKAGNNYFVIGYSNDSQRFYFGLVSDHNHAACACAIDGINCEGHTDAQVYGWGEWKSTNSLPTSAGFYYLTGDVVLTKQQMINANVYICLNGYSITEGTRTEEVGKRNGIIRVGDSGTLTMVNCQAVVKNGKLVKGSAGVKGFTADGTSGAAFHVNAGRTLSLYGIEVSGNTCTNNHTGGWTAGGILVVSDANKPSTLNVDYCRFDGNKATESRGGAIIIRGGTADIRNSVFTDNEAKVQGAAVCVLNQNATITVSDSEFTGNKTTDSEAAGGAAFHLATGTTTLKNVTMTGNENKGHHGTVITLSGSANVILDSCTITGNNNVNGYSNRKGAIAVLNDTAKLIVKGSTVVDNNMNGMGGTSPAECNVYLRTANAKMIVDQLTAGANINVTTGDQNVDKFGIFQPVDDPDKFLTKGVEGQWDPAWDSKWITYEMNGLKVAYSYDEEIQFYFEQPKDHVHCLCGDAAGKGCDHGHIGWVAWDKTDSLPTISGNYYLTKDVSVIKMQSYAGESEVSICLNGHTVKPAKDMKSCLINVYDDAHLNISDCTATGSGTSYTAGKFTGAKDGAIRIGKTDLGNDALINFYDGMIVKNEREYYGGGLRMVGKCTFNMYGGSISNNKCYKAHGGGIGADGGEGVVNIYAGTFSGNSAKQSGGAIMAKKGTINIYNGLFTKNSATDNGGAIYNELGSVYVRGGTFSYNKAPYEKNAKGGYVGQGGAIFVRGDAKNKYGIKLRISGGNFYGNNAWKGGAILTLTYVQVNITGGKFYQNTTGNNGGGIFIGNDCRGSISNVSVYENKSISGAGVLSYKAELEMSNCKIYNNEVTQHAAGVMIQRESKVTMDNVTITGNNAPKNGSAIRADGLSNLTLNGCTISENVSGEGGAIFASSEGTVVTLNDTSIVNNSTEASGGGIAAMSHARIIMNSGEIKGNTAKSVGGGVWIRKGYMELRGGEISGNTAGVSGGGLQIEGIDIIFQRVILEMTDGVVSGNSAPTGGGAVFKSGTSIVTGGTFENNTADYGGGIVCGSIGKTTFENIVVRNNIANVSGGGMYLDRGSINVLINCSVTGNSSKEDGAGIWINDDFNAQDLTVTGNTSEKGVGGVYVAAGDYDGQSYISNLVKIGGKVQITDNKGAYPGLYIANGTLVNVSGYGLTSGTKIDVALESGLLTDTLIGAYNYEGGDLTYVVTPGDRSVTDPEEAPEEAAPVQEQEATEEKESSSIVTIIAIAGIALVVILAGALLIAIKSKKPGKKRS